MPLRLLFRRVGRPVLEVAHAVAPRHRRQETRASAAARCRPWPPWPAPSLPRPPPSERRRSGPDSINQFHLVLKLGQTEPVGQISHNLERVALVHQVLLAFRTVEHLRGVRTDQGVEEGVKPAAFGRSASVVKIRLPSRCASCRRLPKCDDTWTMTFASGGRWPRRRLSTGIPYSPRG